jgi:hypothetical protein
MEKWRNIKRSRNISITIWGENNYIRINSITGSIVRERIDEDSCQWKFATVSVNNGREFASRRRTGTE